jgi:hypothetical protein
MITRHFFYLYTMKNLFSILCLLLLSLSLQAQVARYLPSGIYKIVPKSKHLYKNPDTKETFYLNEFDAVTVKEMATVKISVDYNNRPELSITFNDLGIVKKTYREKYR